MPRLSHLLLAALVVGAPAELAAREREVAVSLSGSRASMERQNRIARAEQYSFLRTPSQVRNYVDYGALVPVGGNDDYSVIASYPFARPVVRAFVERLASRYHAACGEQLVVTSLTRPAARQPRNASPLSVHPAGMAVDLRVSRDGTCRSWLEAELLDLEEMGLLDATRERNPPHFHVAVFPAPFGEYEQALAEEEAEAEAEALRQLQETMTARADSLAAAAVAAPPPDTPDPGTVPDVLVFIAALIARMMVPFVV